MGSKTAVYSFVDVFKKKKCSNSFEEFVVTNGNGLACRVLSSICEQQSSNSTIFNPIYLCGRAGSGKTHLLDSVVSKMRSCGQVVAYCTCEEFTAAIIKTIRDGCLNQFQSELRMVSALVLDEVSYLIGKARIQEEFFHAFNSMHMSGKQIILSSRMSPDQLIGVENRLISRFQWGLLIPIENNCSENRFHLDIQRIIELVCSYYNIDYEQILYSNDRPTSEMRKIIMYLCREILKLPLNIIGSFFRKSDATVSLSYKQVSDRRTTDKDLNKQIRDILTSLQENSYNRSRGI